MLTRDLFAVANLLQIQTVCSTLTIPALRMIFMHSQSFGTCLGEWPITYNGIVLWNTLPDELNGIASARKFVDCVKQNLLDSSDTS